MSTFTPRLLVAAAAAAAVQSGLYAQPLTSIDSEEQLHEQIAELQAEVGHKPVELVDPLRALAVLYQEAGDHREALAALEEARYVTRIHNGLASAEEALLLRQQIRSEKALGNAERVWDLEQDMVTMARQHHDDIRMLPIFRELADDRLAVIEKVRVGERPPMIYAGCYNGAPLPPYDYRRSELNAAVPSTSSSGFTSPSCIGGINQYLIAKLRAEILMYYADAIETILEEGDYASPELRQLERTALSLSNGAPGGGAQASKSGGSFSACSRATLDDYLALEILRSCLAPVGRGQGWVVANVGNMVALIRLISYEIRSGATAAARANAVVELADWHVLAVPPDRRRFERYDELALGLYERVYEQLRQGGDLQAAAQMFTPEFPVTLPTFRRNPFASAASAESPRYIDVAFAVTEHGTGEQIEILETSSGATRPEERDLIRLIETTSFRPRAVNGKLVESAPVVLRYHLSP
jgi:hypothetical protein